MTDAPARAYARLRYRLLLADLGLGWSILAAAQWSGGSVAVARWWSHRLGSEPLAILGYLAVIGVAYYALLWPLHFYASFRLEHRFGLSRLTLRGWWIREAKRVGISAVMSAGLIEGLYAILRASPDRWVAWTTLGWVGVSVVLVRVFPTLLLPIFYQTTPVTDQALVGRLLALCRQAGIRALAVFRFALGTETRKANAALAGLGKTRRVLLSDTLLEQFPPEEIEGVLAHELAHHRYHHLVKGLILSAAGSWIAFTITDLVGRRWVAWMGLEGLADIGGFPVLMLWLSLLGFLALPLQNAIARRFEWQADRCAVAMTGGRPFADALRRLGQLNLADPDPPRWVVWWFYDHPPITDRIRAAAG